MNTNAFAAGTGTTGTIYWRLTPLLIAVFAVAAAGGSFIYLESVQLMVQWWSNREEYSHGFLIPVITVYLIWQRSDRLREIEMRGSSTGLMLCAFSLVLFFVGELSTIYTVIQYAFVLFVIGTTWAFIGTAAFRVIAIPLALLSFMVPFPNFIYNNLSSQLQLLSSEIGVAVIRLFGISVYLEGNVIDLGSYKLQVVEACNGLRYLFPLMTLGVIVGYFYHAALWKRVLIFVSTVPITILMNSFRIGVIGILVEHWGISMAEGFLHDFEGWAIFMACFGILFLEMWLLLRLSNDQRRLSEVFGIEPPRRADPSVPLVARSVPIAGALATLLVVMAIVPAQSLPNRPELIPQRAAFAEFPLVVADWQGKVSALEQVYLDALKLTDYSLVNFDNPDGYRVNFYAAYYASQKKGQSAHSPKSCLPGGGWEIESLTTQDLGIPLGSGQTLRVNRAVISHADAKRLVFYWFLQRGRVITNEYLVKWYVFWDALTRNRTDGALIRLVVSVPEGKGSEQAEAALRSFAAAIVPELPSFIPD